MSEKFSLYVVVDHGTYEITEGDDGRWIVVVVDGAGERTLVDNNGAFGWLANLVAAAYGRTVDVRGGPYDVATLAFGAAFETVQHEVHGTAIDKGWWKETASALSASERADKVLSKLALIHSEVSEALECARDDDYTVKLVPDKYGNTKPEGFASELADVVIRIMDLAEWLHVDVAYALLQKVSFNKTRKHRHGGRHA